MITTCTSCGKCYEAGSDEQANEPTRLCRVCSKAASAIVAESANCPVMEQTADGDVVGRCWFHLPDGATCPRHGDVSVEVQRFKETGRCTLENDMRERKGLDRWPRKPRS